MVGHQGSRLSHQLVIHPVDGQRHQVGLQAEPRGKVEDHAEGDGEGQRRQRALEDGEAQQRQAQARDDGQVGRKDCSKGNTTGSGAGWGEWVGKLVMLACWWSKWG